MNKFLKVMRFSYVAQMRNKGFIISTIIMVVIIAAGISIPSIINLFKSDKNEETTYQSAETPSESSAETNNGEKDSSSIIVVDPQGSLFTDTADLSAMFPDYIWSLGSGTEEELTAKVENDEIFGALIIWDDMQATYIYKTDINMFGSNIASQIRQYLTDTHRYKLLITYNVSEEDAARFFESPVLWEVNVGVKNMAGQVQSMVFIMFLYIAILTSGQLVAMSVVQEKSSRAMEILITTSRPETLMFGKVIGIGLAGLTQMVTFMLTGIAFYVLNHSALSSIGELYQFFAVPPSTFVYIFIFYIGGFFFYAMLFGAIGSLVSRMEDMSSSQTPLTLLTVAGFLVAIYGQLYGFSGSTFYTVCSYIPLTSPYVMLARVCGESTMPAWEAILSIVILYVSTAFVGILSAKIYRIGVLMYGKPPSLKEIVTALKQS